MIRRYVSGTATPRESVAVREYISDDTNRFDLLLELMRNEAMQELGIDPSDDFLPEHLQRCCPGIFETSPAFKAETPDTQDYGRVGASMEGRRVRSAYDALTAELGLKG